MVAQAASALQARASVERRGRHVLARDFDGDAEHIVLAHLSKNTNHPEVARLSAIQALDQRGPLFFRDVERRVKLADPDAPGPWIEM